MAGNPREPGAPGEDELDTTDLEDINPDEDFQAEEDAEGDGEDAEDAGGLGGDAGNDAEGNEGQRQGQARQVAPARETARNRERRLANQVAELSRKNANFERQLAELIGRQSQPSQAEIERQNREELERVQLMAPHEVAAYYAAKTQRTVEQQLNQTRALLFDQNDRSQFNQLLDSDPTLRRYESQVEEFRRQAPGVPREMLLWTAIGKAAMEGKRGARTRGQNQGAAQRQTQAARPSNGRGDVPAERRRTGGDLHERLRNSFI